MKFLRNALTAGMLALNQVLGSRTRSDLVSVEIVEPETEFDSFEDFLRYDDVREPETWMLFGDNPELVEWAERRVMERSLKCQQVWEDPKKRKKLLTGDLDVPQDQLSVDALADQLGIDPDGYWEYSEDPEAPPVWVPFDESWYGENEQ